MIEVGVVPIVCVVTGRAVCAKLAVMLVIARVAGIAVGGRPREDIVLMTIFTTRFGVSALQFKRGQVVIELGGSPRFGGVTQRAVGAETGFVRVILRVAGETVCRRGGKVRHRAHIHMALGAMDLRVFAV